MSKSFDVTSELLQTLCRICQANTPEVIIPCCEHKFCESCIKSYLTLKITEAQVLLITCPELECPQELTSALISDLLPDLLEKFLKFSQNKQKESDPNFRWCPIPACNGYDTKLNSNNLKCNICQFKFCYLCNETCHQGFCKDLIIQNNNNIKRCPNCSVYVEKKSGCPEMYCTNCSFRFCWLCGQELSEHSIKKCFLRSRRSRFYWVLGLILLLFPVVLLFWFPFMLFMFIYAENGHEEYLRNKKKFIFGFAIGGFLSPFLLPIALLILHIYWVFVILKGGYLKYSKKMILRALYFTIYAPGLFFFTLFGFIVIICILLALFPLSGLFILITRLILLFPNYS